MNPEVKRRLQVFNDRIKHEEELKEEYERELEKERLEKRKINDARDNIRYAKERAELEQAKNDRFHVDYWKLVCDSVDNNTDVQKEILEKIEKTGNDEVVVEEIYCGGFGKKLHSIQNIGNNSNIPSFQHFRTLFRKDPISSYTVTNGPLKDYKLIVKTGYTISGSQLPCFGVYYKIILRPKKFWFF